MEGKRFGRLIVVRDSGKKDKWSHKLWVCKCDCGNIALVKTSCLTSGSTRSCGCLRTNSGRKSIHGHKCDYKATKTYDVWRAMKQRCLNKSHKAYKDYGARGITICKAWNDFRNFLADMGESPKGYTLDRISNKGNYEKNNCRWATRKQQANNRRPRKKHYITFICENCGEEFKKEKRPFGKGKSSPIPKCCSSNCRQEARNHKGAINE